MISKETFLRLLGDASMMVMDLPERVQVRKCTLVFDSNRNPSLEIDFQIDPVEPVPFKISIERDRWNESL